MMTATIMKMRATILGDIGGHIIDHRDVEVVGRTVMQIVMSDIVLEGDGDALVMLMHALATSAMLRPHMSMAIRSLVRAASAVLHYDGPSAHG